jgi:hypothetical protein
VHPAVRHVHAHDQLLPAQRLQRVERFIFGHREDRVAVVLLVAPGDQRVERQRVLLRRRQGLLDEHTEHARFDGGEVGHGVQFTADAICYADAC